MRDVWKSLVTLCKDVVTWGRIHHPVKAAARVRSMVCEGSPPNKHTPGFIELVTYIANRLGQHPKFGRLKLAKILFFTDQEWMRLTGRTFTEYPYYAYEYGPYNQDIASLDDRHKHLHWDTPYEKQQRLQAERDADRSELPPEILDIADRFIQQFLELTSRQLSELSHGPAWRLTRGDVTTKHGPLIDPELMFLCDETDIPETITQHFDTEFREVIPSL